MQTNAVGECFLSHNPCPSGKSSLNPDSSILSLRVKEGAVPKLIEFFPVRNPKHLQDPRLLARPLRRVYYRFQALAN